MAGNGRRCRSRWDHAADVAQTFRTGRASSTASGCRRHVGGSSGLMTVRIAKEGNPKWAGAETCGKRLTYNRRGANGVAPMCDYSLQYVKTRPAKVGDKLFTRRFSSGTGGFSAPEDINVAVCLLPGTELSFAYDVRRSRLWPWSKNILQHKTAIFRQVNIDCLHAHHDALEFPDGDMLLLTYLMEGQEAVVLQLPATSSKAPQRAAYV